MNTVNEILHTMNKLMFKHNLTNKELQNFKTIRIFLFKEFFWYQLDKTNLCKLLNIVDDLHMEFIEVHPEINPELYEDFNEIFFELYKQKYEIYERNNDDD